MRRRRSVVVVRFVPRDWPLLKLPLFRPAILCGQHSLEIFCLGVFLAFAGHFALVQISDRVVMQVIISVIGIIAMIGTAWLISWYEAVEGRGPGSRRKSPNADLAGGEA